MKRIKTSNILIATALFLIILLFLFVFLVIKYYSKWVYSDMQNQQTEQHNNYQEIQPFSAIVLSNDVKVKIIKGEKYAIKYSEVLSYTLSNDTLYPQANMLIITPKVKTIIAQNQTDFILQITQDSINLILKDEAVGQIVKSNFKQMNISAQNTSFVKSTPECKLGNVQISLLDKAKASLLGKIDTLSGQTTNKTFIYTSNCKHISARIIGTHTKISNGEKHSGLYIENKNH